MALTKDRLSSSLAPALIKRAGALCVSLAFSSTVLCAQVPGGAQAQALGFAAGHAPAQMPQANLPITPEGLSGLKLAPGSQVNIHVFEEPDLDGSYRIDSHGNISIPLVGNVQVGTLTLREAETAIDARLVAAEILNDPHVTVNIGDYGAQTVVVLGEVGTPGRLPIVTPRRLEDILAMVGGATPLAGSEIVVHRADQPAQTTEVIPFNRSQADSPALNTLIGPGDTVFVRKAGFVYVLGAVVRPGGYLMQEHGSLNVVEALALAFGTSPEAAITRVRILRKSSDGTYAFIPVPLNKIQKGKANPISLQAEDIVYVPPSTIKEVGITARGLLGGVPGAVTYRID